ncbi:MAG: ribosomal RNA small subunit methyltransferase A [Clostridia bacterium]|nr:ribosomal RNA small subunit methyltransferase A [Clostridia bacterium]
MKTARELLTEYGLTPNKALGQNFLVDEEAIERIVSAAAGPGLPVLEIGPGLGALTAPLAESGLPIAAVELDAAMCGVLSSALPENAAVINADFLKADLGLIHEKLGGGEISVVGNLPYYITSPICMRLLTEGLPIRRMTLMMQKEAADRFTAEPGDKNYGPLTVLAQLLYSIRQELSLSPASYFPQPEVSSCVLVLDRSGFSLPAPLPRLLKSAFAMRRKTLLNNLSAMGMTKTAAAELIEKAGLPPSVRAEALRPEDFVRLSR